MKLKHLATGLFLTTLLLLSTVANAQIRAAFVYVGPAAEMGWSNSHDIGRRYLEQTFGSQISTEFVELVPEGRAATDVIRQLAEKNDIVFTTSWGYMIPTLRAAREYPKVKFENITGMRLRDNLSSFADRAYQPRYLSGMLAGAMTQSNTIGYVAAHPTAEVIRGINAFTLGVRRTNPRAEVQVQWTRQWYAPAKARQLAQQMIKQGADVLSHHTDSPAVAQAAEQAGIYVISFHSDMRSLAPTAQLASVGHHWGPYYARSITALQQQQWQSGKHWLGMADDVAQLNHISDKIPAAVRQQVEQTETAIKQGKFAVFSGPIQNSRGSTLVRQDEILSDEDLERMNWYVDGVVGDLVSF
ncbi:BMP family ABC transporter substrate-binding protein [Bacterioplanoides pacificum]|uniref:BMP family ABC transporter substrate-binding protein n=1 Tax=Bacterioplanoides pacificum TaxID=1171596 RepID=A0ABV7VW97_9GAMM